MAMKIGIVLTVDGVPGRAGEFIAETAQAMEELGYASYWAPDHVAFFDTINSTYPHSEDGKFGWLEDQGLMEPIMVLQMAAAATKSIRVGTSVEVITLRNPVVRSKHVATVDHFSGGRFDYGVGIGWMKEEYDASGVPWERRGERADEYIGAMKASLSTSTMWWRFLSPCRNRIRRCWWAGSPRPRFAAPLDTVTAGTAGR
jgi:alkanesulfonate monooxygenase SsuD/methylene tetrahydromethanopterin reductase-like flavin-dependent oxidoreductase (luciferase family)